MWWNPFLYLQHLPSQGSLRLAVSRLAAGKMIYSNYIVFRLNQLSNSFNIFTPSDLQNTNVACQHSQQTRDFDPMLDQFWPNVCGAGSASRHQPNVCKMLGQHRRCWLVSIQPYSVGLLHAGFNTGTML